MGKHLELVPQRRVSSFRKLAIGSWRTAHDPTVYGTLTVRVDAALAFTEAFRARTGVALQLSHLVVRALGEALRRCPEANAVLRFNRIYLRQQVDVSLLVVDGEGPEAELVPAKLERVDGLSLEEVARGLEAAALRVRTRADAALERERHLLSRVPFLLLRPWSRLAALLQHTLNLDLRALGLPRDPFGSAAVVDVGALGLDTAYLPLVPHARVPIVVALGAVREVPLALPGGAVGVGRVMNVNASFDHRFIDGYHAAQLARCVQALLEEPGALPPLDAGAPTRSHLDPELR
ncbi:2-oxo acid dehydrogenase subunit E2 [Aggregicoccus sp. 17bor-14]|nr:2-oxo acid dehydrogenase subunit E2 [Simulacricoccus sp. 17bor-14]MRI88378.1 2-oxo acid dehydrogenase subunit E2 [Aggregicoccus sp. 17bor-14]